MSSDNLVDRSKQMDKIVATFMDAVTKQIEAQTNTYKQKMNRYEKSISILYSALNMIHSSCPEYSEALVEIAKNRRLLAVNKRHLRGQWRIDAIEVD
jgi:competence protein ComGC